jgi:predicted lipid carrier protein YhbT
VHRWSADTGLPAIVLRPSIVLGDWANGRAVRFNTLYHLLRTLDAVGPSLRGQRLRLVGLPDVTKNIIPIDYFAKAAWQIIRRGAPGSYHIVHPEPIRMGDLRQIFSELFDIDLRLVLEDDFSRERGTAAERTCHRIMAPYRPYMTQPEPVFDQCATAAALANDVAGPPRLDAAYFRKLLGYARSANWGRHEVGAPNRDMPADPVCKYFEVFLAERVDQSLLPDLKRLSARVSISMKDQPGSNWWLDLREGVLKAISRDSSAEDCSFTLNSSTFLEIAAGRLAPQRAFFTGRVRIGGNMELGLKVATVLAKFFSDYPFVAEPN